MQGNPSTVATLTEIRNAIFLQVYGYIPPENPQAQALPNLAANPAAAQGWTNGFNAMQVAQLVALAVAQKDITVPVTGSQGKQPNRQQRRAEKAMQRRAAKAQKGHIKHTKKRS